MTDAVDLAELVPIDRVGPLLARARSDDRWLDCTASLIAGGKSNLTFELSCAAGQVILRRPPSGHLLPTAHDMTREARVQRGLGSTAVPVPDIVVLVENGDLIGVPFYVMSKVEGYVIRDVLPEGYARTAAERQQIADALVSALADLHAVDPAQVGLGDFGRPDGFLARQVRRWGKQWQASRDREVAAVDELAAALAARVPQSPPPTIVHGDFRLDNCVMSLDDPSRVEAVLDWEMSTLGDPLTDVGLLLFYWREADQSQVSLTPTVTTLPGFPGRAYLASRYAELTGRSLDELAYYEAFAHFKFAVIAQGIAARVSAGSMAGQDFGDLRGEVVSIAEGGLAALADH